MEKDINYLSQHFDAEMESFVDLKLCEIHSDKNGCILVRSNANQFGILDNILNILNISNLCLENINLEDIEDDRDAFYRKVIEYCNIKELDEVYIYKTAGLNRSIFSKIRNMAKNGYIPSKVTVICICLAFRLNLSETQEMLSLVGYSLSDRLIVDKIIGWCIVHNQFDLVEIANLLYAKTGNAYLC